MASSGGALSGATEFALISRDFVGFGGGATATGLAAATSASLGGEILAFSVGLAFATRFFGAAGFFLAATFFFGATFFLVVVLRAAAFFFFGAAFRVTLFRVAGFRFAVLVFLVLLFVFGMAHPCRSEPDR